MRILLIILFPLFSYSQDTIDTLVCAKSHYELGQYVETVFDSSIEWGYLTESDSIITYKLEVNKDSIDFTVLCMACNPDSVFRYIPIWNDTIIIVPIDTIRKVCYKVTDTAFQKRLNKWCAISVHLWPEKYLTPDSIYKK